jgi:UDP-N-acetylglucosamine:LPS N-acetylglucosamine transferase
MNPRKIFYVLAEVHSAVSFEWIAESQLAHELKFTFILLNFGDTFLERRLRDLGQEVIRIHYASRGDIFSALKALYRLFRQRRPDIVHTHLLAANLAGLIAAWLAKVPVRIYTQNFMTGFRIF